MSEDEPVFTPTDFIRYEARRRSVDEESFQIPKRVILLYQKETFEYARQVLSGKIMDWLYGESRPFCISVVDGKDIGLFRAGVGAPAAAFMLEELIACGAGSVIEVGIAGGLQSSSKTGDIVVVKEALRDEGTSDHYFPSNVALESSLRLRELLIEQLALEGIEHEVGAIWTTDGVYRETRAKFLKFSSKGVLAVNMETSALFAVARYRDIEIVSAQVISDVLSTNGWFPAFKHETVSSSLQKLITCIIKVLTRV